MNSIHPLANLSFLKSLEESGSACKDTGWMANHFEINTSLLPSYIKFHSYGEYIFDWNWANFYQSNNLAYYPKLLHAIPFSPVNAPKLIGEKRDFAPLVQSSFDFYQGHNLSSEHYLFIDDSEEKILNELGFKTKYTHQYHFKNIYESFEHFLSTLKKNKRKNIKKERREISQSDLLIKQHIKDDITTQLLEQFYTFYTSTIIKKNAYAYLTKEFFISLIDQNIMLVTASEKEQTVAMALFFYNENSLYGRLWGILPEFENKYKFLHFELCYYQGIDFCLKNKLENFEAGAQGEHKLTRGFKPVLIKSAHHIKIPQCFDIIKDDIKRNNEETLRTLKILETYLPFKS